MKEVSAAPKITNVKAAILGFQHLLAMYSGDVLVPLLIGAALHFSQEQLTYLVSIDIFMCGIATFLQLKRTPLTGIGLPVVLGCAVQAVNPLIQIGKTYGLGTMYGSIIGAGIFIFLIAGLFSKIKNLFPPVVTGSLITIIGFTLIPVAFQNLGGGDTSAKDFGNLQALGIGFLTIAIILLISVFARGFMKSVSILIGILVGTLIAGAMGMVSLKPVAEASWFHLPTLFYFGTPHFEWSSILTMILVSLTTMVESTGVFFALGDITGRKIEGDDLKRGYRAEGIAYYSEKAYPEAIAAFSRSLNNMDDPDKEFKKDVQFYLAQARMDYGEVDKAIEVYSEILKAGEDEQAFFLRGKAYISMEDYKNAEKDFQRALEGCEDYNLYINIYQIYVDHNKAVDGDAYLKMALELEPQDGEDCYHRGRIYEYEKNYEAARDELKTAMEQGYEDAMLLLGRVYLEMEDPASARSMYQEYLQKSEQGAKAYNGLAMCDIYDGAYDSALENIAQGLKENSKEDEQGLLYNEIVAYEYKRDFATAKEKMKIYLEQYPEDEAALRENEFLSTR